jgi:hypothetical protein
MGCLEQTLTDYAAAAAEAGDDSVKMDLGGTGCEAAGGGAVCKAGTGLSVS